VRNVGRRHDDEGRHAATANAQEGARAGELGAPAGPKVWAPAVACGAPGGEFIRAAAVALWARLWAPKLAAGRPWGAARAGGQRASAGAGGLRSGGRVLAAELARAQVRGHWLALNAGRLLPAAQCLLLNARLVPLECARPARALRGGASTSATSSPELSVRACSARLAKRTLTAQCPAASSQSAAYTLRLSPRSSASARP